MKQAAARYLGVAYGMRPDDLLVMGNYAVALLWQGRHDMANELFCRGKAQAPELFEALQSACAKQQRNAGKHEFNCPTLQCPGPEESELLGRVVASRLRFTDC